MKQEKAIVPEHQFTAFDPEHEAIRIMYGKKVLLHTVDFIGASDKAREKNALPYYEAKHWFGTFPDANFRFFVEGAGLDAEAFHAGVMALHAKPEAERRAAQRRMIAKIDDR